MFCSNCGSKLQDGANFCSVCGTRLVSNIAEPVVTPAVEDESKPAINHEFEEVHTPDAEPVAAEVVSAADEVVEPIAEAPSTENKRTKISFDWSAVKDEPLKKKIPEVKSPWTESQLEKELFDEMTPSTDHSRTLSFIDILKQEKEQQARATSTEGVEHPVKVETESPYASIEEAPSFYVPPMYEVSEEPEEEVAGPADEGNTTVETADIAEVSGAVEAAEAADAEVVAPVDEQPVGEVHAEPEAEEVPAPAVADIDVPEFTAPVFEMPKYDIPAFDESAYQMPSYEEEVAPVVEEAVQDEAEATVEDAYLEPETVEAVEEIVPETVEVAEAVEEIEKVAPAAEAFEAEAVAESAVPEIETFVEPVIEDSEVVPFEEVEEEPEDIYLTETFEDEDAFDLDAELEAILGEGRGGRVSRAERHAQLEEELDAEEAAEDFEDFENIEAFEAEGAESEPEEEVAAEDNPIYEAEYEDVESVYLQPEEEVAVEAETEAVPVEAAEVSAMEQVTEAVEELPEVEDVIEPAAEPVDDFEGIDFSEPAHTGATIAMPADEESEIEALKRRLAELMGTPYREPETQAEEAEAEAASEVEPAVEDAYLEPETVEAIEEVADAVETEIPAEEAEVAPVAEPVAEAVPVVADLVEPVIDMGAEAVAEPVAEPVAEVAPAVEGTVEAVAEPVVEAVAESVAEVAPVVEETVEAVAEPVAEAVSEEKAAVATDALSLDDLEKDLFGEAPENVEAEATKKIDKFYTLYKKNEEFQRLLDEEYNKLKADDGVNVDDLIAVPEEPVPVVVSATEDNAPSEETSATPVEAEAEAGAATEVSAAAAPVEVVEDKPLSKKEARKAAKAKAKAEKAAAKIAKEDLVDDEEEEVGGGALTVVAVIVALLLVILLAVILILNFAPESGLALFLDSLIQNISSYFSSVDNVSLL